MLLLKTMIDVMLHVRTEGNATSDNFNEMVT